MQLLYNAGGTKSKGCHKDSGEEEQDDGNAECHGEE